MKKCATVIAVAVATIVWLTSHALAQPGRPGAGGKPGVKASPQPSGKPGAAKPAGNPTTKPGVGTSPTRPTIPKASGKPGATKPLINPGAKPSTLPGISPGKGGKPGLKPGGGSSRKPGLGGGLSGLKSKPGIPPGLRPGLGGTPGLKPGLGGAPKLNPGLGGGATPMSGFGGGPGLKPAISPKAIAAKFPHGKPAIGPPLLWHLHHHHHHHHHLHHCHWHHWNYRPWVWATWRGLRGWLGYPVRPIVYRYYVSGGYVYNGGTQITTVTEYAEQANEIAESAEEQEEEAEWMPLGMFGVVQNEGDDIEVTVQLALAKDGTIGGTYRNTAVDVTLPLAGAVDEKTQRAAWKIGDEDAVVMETGLENLTKDKSTVLLHFENGVTETWTLLRMDESAAKEAVAELDDKSTLEQLAEAAEALNDALPDEWKAYLALPDEVSAGATPDPDALRATLKRYETVAGDSKYSKITELPEFQETHELLTSYVQELSSSDSNG